MGRVPSPMGMSVTKMSACPSHLLPMHIVCVCEMLYDNCLRCQMKVHSTGKCQGNVIHETSVGLRWELCRLVLQSNEIPSARKETWIFLGYCCCVEVGQKNGSPCINQ